MTDIYARPIAGADTYVVWRRSDGLVGATAYVPRDHRSCTFEVLLKTADWAEAHARILAERGAADRAEGAGR